MGVLTGGDGGVDEHEENDSYLWDGLGAAESGRRRAVRGGNGPAAMAAALGGALVGLGERGRVGDLQWPERDPFQGSAREEVVRRRGRGCELPSVAMAGSARSCTEGGEKESRERERAAGAASVEGNQRRGTLGLLACLDLEQRDQKGGVV